MLALTDDIKKVLSKTDLVLLDIKHINDKKCKELVGFSNKLELEFARYLSDNNIPMWIRQVIIPEVTDNEEDLLELKKFISTLKNVEKVDLLPYHNLGEFKWNQLGLEYPFKNIRAATNEDIKKVQKIIE